MEIRFTKMADCPGDSIKPPVIMKVDAPAEEERNEDNEENERREKPFDINAPRICSPASSKSILSTPKLGSNPFALGNRNTSSILRPPQLTPSSLSNTSTKTFTLKPSNLNPFNKPVTEGSSNNHTEVTKENATTTETHKNGDVLKFVPLVQTDKTKETVLRLQTSIPKFQASPSFIFGQNLQERVIQDNIDDVKPSTSCLESNGTSDMLFSNAVKETIKVDQSESQNKEVKSLSESAREYEEARSMKRKYEEVEVRTGEEEETNVIQITCKLFSYDKNVGNWQERGRGTLRLNDFEVNDNGSTYKQSRLVFRTSGSLRVILNTKIWAEMMVEQASAKSTRLTAIDGNGEIKVFLIMATPEENKQLFKYIDDRVRNEAERIKQKKLDNSEENSPNKKIAVDSSGQ